MDSKVSEFQTLLGYLEDLARMGNHRQIQSVFSTLDTSILPRQLAVHFSEIARRSNQPLLALKILNPFVRSKNPAQSPASAKELANYGVSLLTLGASHEASEILSRVNTDDAPEALLYQAFLLFGEWNYLGAIPILKKFIQHPALPDYRRLVGQVNLCAAYVAAGKWAEAECHISEALEKAQSQNHQLLYANLLEIEAQFHIFQKNYSAALQILFIAQKKMNGVVGWSSFLIEKWIAIAKFMQAKNPNDTENFNSLRAEAKHLHHWETLRDLDLFESVGTQNFEQMQKLIIGTPFKNYHARIKLLFGLERSSIKDFHLKIGDDQLPPVVYDLEKSTDLVTKATLYQAYVGLTRDFYKPASIGQLFHCIYPKEYFSPLTSEVRLLKTLYRLNNYFKKYNLPLHVNTSGKYFQLHSSRHALLRIPFFSQNKEINSQAVTADFRLKKLRDVVGLSSFDCATVSRSLDISKTLSLKIISSAIEEKKIIKIDQGRSTRYRFANQKKAA